MTAFEARSDDFSRPLTAKAVTTIIHKIIWMSTLSGLILSACAPQSFPVPSTFAITPPPLPSITSSPVPSETPIPTATPPRTPPALPPVYQSSFLNPNDTPHTYIQDACLYFKMRWDPNNSTPGTVVMVIMFHSITDGEVTQPDQISMKEFRRLMDDLHEQGFQAITTEQLVNFLEYNAKIPPRSVLLIVDDRKYRAYFDKAFFRYWQNWGWPVVNAWISHPETVQPLWDDNAALEAEGWVDHQAHGVIHNVIITESSSDDFIASDFNGSIAAMQQHFNKTPIAFIWPGGGFTPKAVQMARQAGYRLGFTINPRGPLMFNWIPLTDASDPIRPSYLPEGPAGDPLLTLPRYWATDVRAHIDEVRIMGSEAAAYAEQNKAIELEYYDIVCAPTYGPISTAAP